MHYKLSSSRRVIYKVVTCLLHELASWLFLLYCVRTNLPESVVMFITIFRASVTWLTIVNVTVTASPSATD